MATDRTFRVLIVDDHPVVREGLAALLRRVPWVESTHEAGNTAEAVGKAVAERVDVAIVDLRLGAEDGAAATAQLLRARPDLPVLVFTMCDGRDDVARALRAGARGYMVKQTTPESLVEALDFVIKGHTVLGPQVDAPGITDPTAEDDWPEALRSLTLRERDILLRLVCGEDTAAMARSLGLADKTVQNYVSGLLNKLNAPNRVAAVLLAQQAGIDQILRRTRPNADDPRPGS